MSRETLGGAYDRGARPPRGGRERARRGLAYGWLILKESVLSFDRNNNFQTAATLAYYGFFSLIPLLLLVVILLGQLSLSSQEVMGAVKAVTLEILPDASELLLREIQALSGQKIWGIVSLVILIWVVTPFASALRTAFKQIFKVETNLGLIHSNLINVAAVLALLILFILLVVGRILYSSLTGALLGPPLAAYLQVGFPLLATLLLILFFFVVFCPVRLTRAELLTGTAVTAALLFALRTLFLLMLRYNPDYGFTFGSLKAVFLITAWVYYSFLVILFGTEVAANLRRREALLLRGLFLPPPRRSARPPALLRRFIRSHGEGELLCREGDPGAEMFFVHHGEVAVEKEGKPVRRLGPGEFLGEMSMLLGEPRSATIVVSAPETELVAVSRENFETILRENPKIVYSMLREMALRLKRTTGTPAPGGGDAAGPPGADRELERPPGQTL